MALLPWADGDGPKGRQGPARPAWNEHIHLPNSVRADPLRGVLVLYTKAGGLSS